MRNVHVRYGLAPRAQTELAFAADLARRISARLFVWTESDAPARALLERFGDPDAAGREHAHVGDRVRLAICRLQAGLTPSFCSGDPAYAVRDPESIVVGAPDARGRTAASTVATMGEASIDARGGGEICLPFANGESAVHAASVAIPLAARLGKGVFFYHTTWRREGLPDDAPAERHMTAEALAVLARIGAMADEGGVKHRALVETATAIAEGAVRAALRERCCLFVLARGQHVGRGSYVDQMLGRSVIPVLVAGRSAS